MAEDSFNPSSCDVTLAIITSYDGSTSYDISSNFIGSWSITQSMGDFAWQGEAFIMDASNLLEGFPLRGEEYFELWLETYDVKTTVKLKARIHKITDIVPAPNSNSVTYKIHFVSETSWDASLRKITKPYQNGISSIARNIFENYFAPLGPVSYLDPIDRAKVLPMATARYPIESGEEPQRSFVIQPTGGLAKIIIPDLSPADAMFFIAARAFNAESPSQTFRFFETFDGYYFCTDEYFLKGVRPESVKNLFYAPNVPLTGQNLGAQVERIEELQVLSKGIDSYLDMTSGSYRNEVVEIDLIRREFNISKFNFDNVRYVSMDGKLRDLADNPHTSGFRQDTFTAENAKRFILYKNYQKPGDTPGNLQANKHIAEIVHNRVSYYHHLNNTVLLIGLKGRLDLRPGNIVNVDMKELNNANPNSSAINNRTLSGRYLLQSVQHTMDEQGILNTAARIVKFDWNLGSDYSSEDQLPEE